MDDYATWKAQDTATGSSTAAMASYVDADGHYSSSLASEIISPSVAHLVGLSVLSSAPSAVLDDLRNRNLLVASAKIRHKYPYDWRTKQPVIVRSTPQWFANVENIKEKAVQALQEVNFVPEQGRSCVAAAAVHPNLMQIVQVGIDCKRSQRVAPNGVFPGSAPGAFLSLSSSSRKPENLY